MFDRLARFVVRRRRATAGTIAIVPCSPRLGDVTNSDEASVVAPVFGT